MTTATPSTDELSLLGAVRRDPDDDTVRLAYADYLAGLDSVSVKCPKCINGAYLTSWLIPSGCRNCGGDDKPLKSDSSNRGTGFIPDTSARDRAELIRVQCELAKLPNGRYGCRKCTSSAVVIPSFAEEECCCQYKPRQRELNDRAKAIIAAHPDWLPQCPACVECMSAGAGNCGAGNCSTCFNNKHDATGRIGTFQRGMIEMEVPSIGTLFVELANWAAKGLTHDQRYQLTTYARTLRDGWPHVVSVRVKDRVPETLGLGRRCGWVRDSMGEGYTSCRVSDFLFDALECGKPLLGDDSAWEVYDTPEAAHAQLGYAVARCLFSEEFT